MSEPAPRCKQRRAKRATAARPARAPGREAPPGPAPGVISLQEIYTLAEVRKRLGWRAHSLREARRLGLRVIRFGRAKYVTGRDLANFFAALAQDEDARRNGEAPR